MPETPFLRQPQHLLVKELEQRLATMTGGVKQFVVRGVVADHVVYLRVRQRCTPLKAMHDTKKPSSFAHL
jgi:hypothetical protein